MARFQHRKSIQRLLSQLTPRVSSFEQVNKWGASIIKALTSLDDLTTLYARVTMSAPQLIPTGVTTTLSFDTVRWNNGGLYDSAAPTRLTAPVSGVYLIGLQVAWAVNATGIRGITIRYNGADIIAQERVNAITGVALSTDQGAVTEWPLNEGDYVEARVVQDSGGDLNVNTSPKYSPEFYASWLYPLQE